MSISASARFEALDDAFQHTEEGPCRSRSRYPIFEPHSAGWYNKSRGRGNWASREASSQVLPTTGEDVNSQSRSRLTNQLLTPQYLPIHPNTKNTFCKRFERWHVDNNVEGASWSKLFESLFARTTVCTNSARRGAKSGFYETSPHTHTHVAPPHQHGALGGEGEGGDA